MSPISVNLNNAVASLKPANRRCSGGNYGCDPRLNAVASLKPDVAAGGVQELGRDPRLNAVASLKPGSVYVIVTCPGVIHGLMPWPH